MLAAAAVGAAAGALAASVVLRKTRSKPISQAFREAEARVLEQLRSVQVVPVLVLDGTEEVGHTSSLYHRVSIWYHSFVCCVMLVLLFKLTLMMMLRLMDRSLSEISIWV